MLKNTLFDKHVFIHTHIEKCGGSTLLQHMTTLLGNQYVYDLRASRPRPAKEILQRYPDIQKKMPNIRLLSGHIWYGTPWAKLFPNSRWISKLLPPNTFSYCRKQPLYIASIRHPIDRLNSFFRYLQANPDHVDYNETVKNNDFDQFVQELVQTDNLKSKNALCMQITRSRTSLNLLEKAKNAFNQHYFSIVPYNKTHELANMIAEVLELPNVENCIVNLNRSEKKIIPRQETIALLTERCREDIELYDYVCKGYVEKLANAKKHLRKLL